MKKKSWVSFAVIMVAILGCLVLIGSAITGQGIFDLGSVVNLPSQPEIEIVFGDNDGGTNPFLQGTCIDSEGEHEDFCAAEGIVTEYYYSSDGTCKTIRENCEFFTQISTGICQTGMCRLKNDFARDVNALMIDILHGVKTVEGNGEYEAEVLMNPGEITPEQIEIMKEGGSLDDIWEFPLIGSCICPLPRIVINPCRWCRTSLLCTVTDCIGHDPSRQSGEIERQCRIRLWPFGWII
ncbi:MAG: hypothetical protein ABH817_02330 [archaeon]